MTKNEQLRELYLQWYKETLLPFYKKNSTTKYSMPFVSGMLTKEKPLLMIIGQEARIYNPLIESSNFEEQILKGQNWSLGYLSRQLYKNDTYKTYYNESITYNNSPFWHYFRNFKDDYNIVWSNLDKIHGLTKGNNVKPLKEDDEVILNQRNLSGKSILEKEIEIIQPDLIIFNTGTKYQQSMETALGLKHGILQTISQKIEIEKNELPITSLKGCGNPSIDETPCQVFWTYHPNYLNYKRKLKSCIEYIKFSQK